MIEKDNQSRFLYQSEWTYCNWNAVVNIPKKRINIYLDSTSWEFTITNVENFYKDDRKNIILFFTCKDDYNNLCSISFVTMDDENSKRRNLINVEYKNSIYVFSYKD